ncbi:Formylglycine-generating enzyme family protein [Candidatus Electrothrix laxa]
MKMKMKMNSICIYLLVIIIVSFLKLSTSAHAMIFPIVVGAKGDALTSDVVKGKTFSSQPSGREATGTLELPPNAQSYTNSLGMIFHFLPSGTFTMGSPDGSGSEEAEPGRDIDETQHLVTLSKSFYMQTTEVTNKQWNVVIVDTALGVLPSDSHTGDNYPVENVNWYEAAYFANALSGSEGHSECYDITECSLAPGDGMQCSSVVVNADCTGYRLPTEAEWEYAARATTTTAYANPVYFDSSNSETGLGFNDNLHAMGWYYYNNEMENSHGEAAYESGTKPVSAKQANHWGLFDMHGNVWEWCQDWWDGSAYSSDSVTDPQGDETGSSRVVRGGSWKNYAERARSAVRLRNMPAYSSDYIGFRLVLSSRQ